MEDSKITVSTDYEGLKSLQALREKQLLQQRLQTKIGGVISLKSLWSATCPEKLKRVKGHTAVVKAKESENGLIYLYIEIPFVDGDYEELRLIGNHSYLGEDDEVDIFSIIAIFVDKGNGETIIRYDAKCLDEKSTFNCGEIRSDIIHRCTDLMLDSGTVEMPIKVTYEGDECPPVNYGIIRGNNSITLFTPYNPEWYDESSSGLTLKIVDYRNARPLTHGLILAESLQKQFSVMNADSSVLCKDINQIDYGPDYLICNSRLWWFNKKSNLWEEKIFNPYGINNFAQRMQKVSLSLSKIQITSDIFIYIYECEFWGEKLVGDAENPDWEPGYETSYVGIIDSNGSWVIQADEGVNDIKCCNSIIIVSSENFVTLYDSKRKARGLYREVMTIDKCEIKHGKYLLLTKDSLQGVYDAETESLVVPCCIDAKYTLKPNTIRNGLIGVYAIVDKKSGKHTFQKRKYYFLDYQGNIKLEIEDGWIINSGFRDGQAIISMKDDYHGDYYERTIDINGNVLKEDYRSFSGIYSDYEKENQRNQDKDIWDAMTDGMYGDYPEEGFDGDFEFTGK